MNISERTVKFHLENARAKLDALNTTHAVAKALATGAIALF
jgi:DNA-binding CsgD family transcriptional regulator